MGVDSADFNGDGKQDLFVANVDQEMFSLYRNDGNEFFSDVAAANGVAQSTRLLSGWGLKFFDYDNDGLVDLFLANGHPDDMVESYTQQVRYKEPLLLFHHDGTKLVDVSTKAGPAFQKVSPARGLAIGDYNNDGRIDVLIGNNGAAPVLLKNNTGDGNHWVGVYLQGTACNRDAVGATITWSSNGRTRTRYKSNGGSYLSSHDMREVLGLGTAATVDWIEIKWPPPSGRVERVASPPIDRYITIVEGKGRIG
jgi:enediyne biosynthesis protein E4